MHRSDLHQVPTAQRDTKAFQVTPALTNFRETSLFQVSWRHHTDNWALGSRETASQGPSRGFRVAPWVVVPVTASLSFHSGPAERDLESGHRRPERRGCIWFRHPSFRQELLHWPQQIWGSFKKMTKMSWKFSVLLLSACTLGKRLVWVQNVHSVWAGSTNHFNFTQSYTQLTPNVQAKTKRRKSENFRQIFQDTKDAIHKRREW